MLIKRPADIPASEITPEPVYRERRRFLREAALLGAGSLLAAAVPRRAAAGVTLGEISQGPFSTVEKVTEQRAATTYNNFYELGTDKLDPVANASLLQTEPWSVTIDGEVERPGSYAIEDLLRPHPLEERVYRLRCVEAWSMVIPWVGFPLGHLLKRFGPTSRAKYVAFQSIHDPARLPGQQIPVLDWPYVEGLRIDEAMHPLTLLVVGMYGQVLPPQNGAPLRLVVPWKYGFKSAKSIVRITLTEREPPTAWNRQAPGEYGFYSNVNPEVQHPRWSQRRERRIEEYGELFHRRIDTRPFNGYAEQVAHLYQGMDLRRDF
ncbi:MAG TPA: protein-methionine-sulfoxide reductase catalytic subunit MsrP [Gammaproteobacteria bacterium]